MGTEPCNCPAAGYCQRHVKTKDLAAWEKCQNDEIHRQRLDDLTARRKALHTELQSEPTPEPVPTPEIPAFQTRAWNFAKALATHLKDGMNKVNHDRYRQRLEICQDCPSNMRDGDKCNHHKCGCVLTIKTRWASEACPVGHWKAIRHIKNDETGKYEEYEVQTDGSLIKIEVNNEK